MAFLGDFGKYFLGGAKTGDVASATALAFGADPLTAQKIGGGAQMGADALSKAGQTDIATAPAAAGVDSAATLSQVSQTSQLDMGRRSMMAAQQDFNLGNVVGNVVTGLFGGASRVLTKPGVTGLLGGAAVGAVVDFFIDEFGRERKLVITRKMQRDVKKLFFMSGGDFNMTAELYRMATGRQITPEQVVKIITKTFKNQGPYVTKAAVRKTRSTIRKMETLCDLKDRLCPPKRRAPARRRTMSTSITQVK